MFAMHNEDGFFVLTALGYISLSLSVQARRQSKRGLKTLVESIKSEEEKTFESVK